MNGTFSKELAQALREAEEKPITVSREELLHTTYQRLCHDDPVRVTAAGCQALQKALIDADSPYALSTRLIAGVRHCHQRHIVSLTNEGTASNSTAEANTGSSEGNGDEITGDDNLIDASSHSLLQPEEITSASAYAQFAWCIHADIPLHCCRSTELQEAGGYLGSYVSSHEDEEIALRSETVIPGQGTAAERADADAFIERAVATNRHNHTNGHQNGETDSLAEVFASESDASDFEFESFWNPDDQIAELSEWAAAIHDSWDPLQLSKPPRYFTWCNVATSVSHLLQSFTHSQITTITRHQWKTLRISDHLTQLCLALLVPASSQHSPMLTSDRYTSDHWQRLGLQVLNVFRDATLQHLSSKSASTNDTTMLQEYLRLVRILVQVDDQNTSSTVSPATWVGLSSLSALCSELNVRALPPDGTIVKSNMASILQLLQSSVVDACDDLTEILEKSSEKDKEDILALQWTYLSIFQILTTPATTSANSEGTMPADYAHTLLNSGLFRQWLVYWSRTEDAACRAAVQASIFDLCVGSPTLLGKYAWRFPELAEQVTADHVVAAEILLVGHRSQIGLFLWNLFGIYSAASESRGSTLRVQWKPKSNGVTPLKPVRVITAASCQQAAWSLLQSICQSALKILTDWKLRRDHNLESSSMGGNSKLAMQREVLYDFVRLANRLSTPLLHSLFVQNLVPDGCLKIREELRPIQHLLSQWPAVAGESLLRKPDTEDDDDNEKEAVRAMTKNPSYPREEVEAVSLLRKAIKTMQLAIDNTNTGTSKLRHQSFSSKVD